MGRRGSGGSRGGFSGSSRQIPASSTRDVPARAPPAAPVAAAPAAAAPRQPGLMAQMATTAAGVAVGSTIGHVAGAALMGGGGHGEAAPAPQAQQDISYVQQQQQPYPYAQQQQLGGFCQLEMKQFLECAQSQHDLTLCSGFSEALRSCKISNGIQ